MTATAVLPRPRRSSEGSTGGPPAARRSRAADSQRVLHQLVRRELGLLAEVSAWTAATDAGHTTALARHAELIGRVLLHHHAVEREQLWPALRRSLGSSAEAAELETTLAGWTADCARIDHLVRDLGTAARQWTVTAAPAARDTFARSCRELAAAVTAQTAEEERSLLPLLERHLDPADWIAIARSAGAHLSARERTLLVGLALEDACAPDRDRLLSGLPVATRAAWRLGGHSRYRATVVRLRGAPPAQ